MPYLSFEKEGDNKAIAVLKTPDGSSKCIYISDKESKEYKCFFKNPPLAFQI